MLAKKTADQYADKIEEFLFNLVNKNWKIALADEGFSIFKSYPTATAKSLLKFNLIKSHTQLQWQPVEDFERNKTGLLNAAKDWMEYRDAVISQGKKRISKNGELIKVHPKHFKVIENISMDLYANTKLVYEYMFRTLKSLKLQHPKLTFQNLLLIMDAHNLTELETQGAEEPEKILLRFNEIYNGLKFAEKTNLEQFKLSILSAKNNFEEILRIIEK